MIYIFSVICKNIIIIALFYNHKTIAQMKLFTRATLTLIVFVSLTRIVSAQTVNSGAWMVGGTVGFNSVKSDGDDNSETWFNMSPDVAYYIIDDLAIGS